MSKRTATKIKEGLDWQGDATLYQLSAPITYEGDRQTDFVWVSAVCAIFSGPETFIFPADDNGEVLGWAELEGSFRGGLDHERALRGAGYSLEVGS